MKVQRTRNRKVYRSRRSARSGRERSIRRWHVIIVLFTIFGACVIAGVGVLLWYVFTQPQSKTQITDISAVYENSNLPFYDNSYLLTIANSEKPLSDKFELKLMSFGGVQIDERIVPYLATMMNDAKQQGISLKLKGGYVSSEDQHELYTAELNSLKDDGLIDMKAVSEASYNVGDGGCHDLQTGMSVSFSTDEDGDFKDGKAFRWLVNNAQQYGFVWRYPDSKTLSTNHKEDYEVFRFVGIDNAVQMNRLNMCLEEYSQYINSRN